MTIQIKLSDVEIKGIKAYLKDMDEPTDKKGIEQYIFGLVTCTLYSSAECIADYIQTAKS